jgi:uncharacterized protein
MIRAVVDTNVIISGLFWKGPPQAIFTAALDRDFISITSEALIAEFANVINRPKFARLLSQRNLTSAGLITAYRSVSILTEAAAIPPDAVRDSKDRMVIACAVGGQVDYIISGDKDLLVLGSYGEIPIQSPASFLPLLNNAE